MTTPCDPNTVGVRDRRTVDLAGSLASGSVRTKVGDDRAGHPTLSSTSVHTTHACTLQTEKPHPHTHTHKERETERWYEVK